MERAMQFEDFEREVRAYNEIYDRVETPISVHGDIGRLRAEYASLFDVFPNSVNESVRTRELIFDGHGGPIEGRLFSPKGAQAVTPAVIYIHGGGFIAGNVSVADGIASDIAATLGVRVVTFHYRLAPETRFPGALLDTVSVAEQVAARKDELGIDANCILLSGESCGGNLSVAGAMMLARKGSPPPIGIVPLNPIFDVHRWARKAVLDVSTSFANEIYEYTYGYLGPYFTWTDDAAASPLRARAIGRMPPAFFWTPRKDPLHLEVLQLAERLLEEGNSATVVIDEHAVHVPSVPAASSPSQTSRSKRFATAWPIYWAYQDVRWTTATLRRMDGIAQAAPRKKWRRMRG